MKHRVWLSLFVLFLSMLVAPLHTALADEGGQNIILGGSYILGGGEQRPSDLTVIGGKVDLQERSLVEGNVVIVGGEATIDGEVRGDVVAWGGQISLGKAAVVDGDLVTFGTVRRHASAQVKGTVIEGLRLDGVTEYLARVLPSGSLDAPVEPTAPPLAHSRETTGVAGNLITMLLLMGVAALVITLLPVHVGRMDHAMGKHTLLSLGIGSLTLILVLILLPLLIIVCLGIPLAIILAIAFVLCGVLGWVAAGKMVGRRLLHALHSSRISLLGETLLGTLVITLLSMVPCAGILLALGIVCWGVGGAVLTRLGTSDYPPDRQWVAQPKAPEPPSEPPAASSDRRSGVFSGRDTRPLSETEIWGP
jgi:hypothetical protein